jgi:hypothetical protein
MTREELGRHGWTVLHMISATLPEEFDEEFVFKINVFLNLLYFTIMTVVVNFTLANFVQATFLRW